MVVRARDTELLAYPHRWFLTCRYGGCSCHFWHSDYREEAPDFGPLEPWMGEEDPEDVEATSAFFELVARIVGEGHRIDVTDMSDEMMPQYVRSIHVSLREVSRENLRFYDGWRLDFGA